MYQYSAIIVLSGIPIQHISQCLPKRLQSLFALLIIWHHGTSPDQHNLHLTLNGFTAYDIARHRTWKDVPSCFTSSSRCINCFSSWVRVCTEMKVINCVFSTDDIRQAGAFLRGRPTIFRLKFLTLSRGIIRTSAARTAGRRFISMYSRTRRSETPRILAASLVET